MGGDAGVVVVGVYGGGARAVPPLDEGIRAQSPWVACTPAARASMDLLGDARTKDVVGKGVGVDDVTQDAPLGEVRGGGLHMDVSDRDVNPSAIPFGPDNDLYGA